MGRPTHHHRFRFASAIVLVSVRGAAAPLTGAGEVHCQCFASVSRCTGVQTWLRLAGASCWISLRLQLGLALDMRRSCGTRPLRPPAPLLHNAAFQKVLCSRCAKASLGAHHRFAPLQVSKIGVMQSGLRWKRSPSRRRSPVASRPTRRQLYALVVMGIVAYVRRFAHCFVQRPPAVHVVFAPAHPWGLLASQHHPRGLPVRPQRGLPQNRASSFFLTVIAPASKVVK